MPLANIDEMAGDGGGPAAIADETRWVHPLKPWRPSKSRFEAEARRSPGASLSGLLFWGRGRGTAQQALGAQILVDLGPMDSMPARG
jgi:hypothetical protein